MAPNQPKTPARAFRPPPELWDQVVARAEATGTTYTEVLIAALEEFFRVDVSTHDPDSDVPNGSELD